MALDRRLCVTGILQIIGNLLSIAFCAQHFYESSYFPSRMSHNPALFTLRIFPATLLLATGSIAILGSCLNKPYIYIAHITMTCATSVGQLILFWYFTSIVVGAEIQKDSDYSLRCLCAVSFNIVVNATYLVYCLVTKLREKNGFATPETIDSKSTAGSTRMSESYTFAYALHEKLETVKE